MYQFTFARHTRGSRASLLQRVVVRAHSAREAWTTFEAVYPYRHFVAFRMERLHD